MVSKIGTGKGSKEQAAWTTQTVDTKLGLLDLLEAQRTTWETAAGSARDAISGMRDEAIRSKVAPAFEQAHVLVK